MSLKIKIPSNKLIDMSILFKILICVDFMDIFH